MQVDSKVESALASGMRGRRSEFLTGPSWLERPPSSCRFTPTP